MSFNFVDSFIDYTRDAESPTSYFRWAAYATLSATLRDNVYIKLPMGLKVMPNIFVLILSRRSSLVKKSTPLKVALRLITTIKNTKVINGRATIAGIINVLTAPKVDSDGKPMEGAIGILYNEELSSMFIEDRYATDTLTAWYDGHDNWGSHLNSTGVLEMENICISMLASSNEELIRSVYTGREMQGGLLARTILIMESKKRHKNSLMYATPTNGTDGEMIHHLKNVSKLKGEMFLTDDARAYYDRWYNEFEPLEENSSKTGIEGRIHFHALKLAILKSAATRLDRVIDLQCMIESIQECLDLLPNYHILSSGSHGPLEDLGRELIFQLLESPQYMLPKDKIMWNFWAAGSSMINNVLETLVEANNLVMFTHPEHQTLYIKLTPLFLERYYKKIGQENPTPVDNTQDHSDDSE